MSHYSLLALSLLAQGTVADLGDGLLKVPQIDELDPPVPQTFSEESLIGIVENILDTLPTVDDFQPQFSPVGRVVQASWSQPPILPLFPPQPRVAPMPVNWRPVSGIQLYQQRLAALQAGQIYTRLPADSFADRALKATEQPTHQQWQWLLELEAKAIATGQGHNRLNVLVGDSLSVWFPHDQLPQGKLWLNQSVSGEATGHILKRLHFLKPTQPDRIFVLAGVNDLRQGVTDEVIIQNWRTLVQTLRQQHPHAEIILQSLLPTRLAAIPNDRIRHLNEHLAAIAHQNGATYLDLYTRFTDDQGNLDRNLTTDGIHLSRQGYSVWQQVLQEYENPQILDRSYHAADVHPEVGG